MYRVRISFVLLLLLGVFASIAYGLGSDHVPGKPIRIHNPPKGLAELVNSRPIVHGFWVNSSDVLYYSGNTDDFNQFVARYAQVHPILEHKIIVHDGKGFANSPWRPESKKPCDWMLESEVKTRRDIGDAAFELQVGKSMETGELYRAVTLHVWKDGNIDVTKIRAAERIEVVDECPPEEPGDDEPKPTEDKKEVGTKQESSPDSKENPRRPKQ